MPINSDYSTNRSTIGTNLTSVTTTEGEFRQGINSVLDTLDDINDGAVNTVTAVSTNNVTPVRVTKTNNAVTITSNIVIGTADPPVAGTDFSSGQIYFRVE